MPASCHRAFGIAGHAGPANLRPHRIDPARGCDATLPVNAEQRSPSQRIPDSLLLTNFRGIRSSAASSSVVNRGQLLEYEQQAPQAWHGLVLSMIPMAAV